MATSGAAAAVWPLGYHCGANPTMAAPGTFFGPYRISSLVGAGGMGEVYRAHDPRLGRDVAIKLLPPHLGGDVDAVARLTCEARAVAALSHPGAPPPRLGALAHDTLRRLIR